MAGEGVEKELRSGTGARGDSCRFFFSSNEDVGIDIVMLLKLLNGYGSLLELRPLPPRFIALGIFFPLPALLSTGASCRGACFTAIAKTFLL